MASSNETFELWVQERLASFHIDSPDIAIELLRSQNAQHIQDYLYGILGKDAKVEKFVKRLLERLKTYTVARRIEMPDDVTVLRGKDEEEEEFWSTGGANKKKGKKPKSQPVSDNQTVTEQHKGNLKITTITTKKDHVGIRCNCQATEHNLRGNCLSCGKIICEAEPEGACTFCGFDAKNKKGGQVSSDTLEKAIKHKNKLIDYQENSAKRTIIYDDQSDYWTNNNWLNPEEKKEVMRREEENKSKKEDDRKKIKITFDFAGRRVVEEDKLEPLDENAVDTRSNAPLLEKGGKSEKEKGKKIEAQTVTHSNGKTNNDVSLVCDTVPMRPEFIPKKKSTTKPKSTNVTNHRVQHDYYSIDTEKEETKNKKERPFQIRGLVEGPDNFTPEERKVIVDEFIRDGKVNHYLYCCRYDRDMSWRDSYSAEQENSVKKVVEQINRPEVQFNFAITFGEDTEWDDAKDVQRTVQKISALQKLKSKKYKLPGPFQAKFVNQVIQAANKSAPPGLGSTFYIYPKISFGNIEERQPTKEELEYWLALHNHLESNVTVLFHGPEFVSTRITLPFCEKLRNIFQGRKILLWDNFPVSDSGSRLIYSGAYDCRDPTINSVVEGILLHPLQQRLMPSLFSLQTAFHFLSSPISYQPDFSQQAVLTHLCGDERLAQDLIHIMTASPKPSTPFIDRSIPQGLLQRRLKSRAFFEDILERIGRIANAMKESRLKLGHYEVPTRMICEMTRRFSVYNVDRIIFEEFRNKGGNKADAAVMKAQKKLEDKLNESKKLFDAILTADGDVIQRSYADLRVFCANDEGYGLGKCRWLLISPLYNWANKNVVTACIRVVSPQSGGSESVGVIPPYTFNQHLNRNTEIFCPCARLLRRSSVSIESSFSLDTKRWHASLLLGLCLASVVFGACPPAVQSQYSLWPSGKAVTITANQKIIIKTSPNVQLGPIIVDGSLSFADANIQLNTTSIFVRSGGSIIAGSSECPITNKLIITLCGRAPNPRNSTVIGRDTYDAAAYGAKGIVIAWNASIQLYGSYKGPTWTHLAQNAARGTQTITLLTPVNWAVGDEIFLTNTDYEDAFSTASRLDQHERRKIVSIDTSKTSITLNSPLNFTHYGQHPMRGEVGHLTRRIVIQGDEASEMEDFGGHLLIRRGPSVGSSVVSGVELNRMGQTAVLGRYPIHLHVNHQVYGMGVRLAGNAIHDSYQRCISVHETHGATVEENVAFNISGHCYFIEDGSEMGNTFHHNLGAKVYPMVPPLLYHDGLPSVFWISNPNNTCLWLQLRLLVRSTDELHYKCKSGAIWSRGRPSTWRDSYWADFGSLGFFPLNGQFVINSTLVANSSNMGLTANNRASCGVSNYDTGSWTANIENTFINFTSPQGAICDGTLTPQAVPPLNWGMRNKFINANPTYITGGKVAHWGVSQRNYLDDGSGTGLPYGGWMMGYQPYLNSTEFDGSWISDWNAIRKPYFHGGMLTLFWALGDDFVLQKDSGYGVALYRKNMYFRPIGQPATAPGLHGTDWSNGYLVDYPTNGVYAGMFISQAKTRYSLPTSLKVSFDGNGKMGDWLIVALPYPVKPVFNITINSAPSDAFSAVTSLANLVPRTFFWNDADNHVYIPLVKTGTSGSWTNNKGFSSYTTGGMFTVNADYDVSKNNTAYISPKVPATLPAWTQHTKFKAQMYSKANQVGASVFVQLYKNFLGTPTIIWQTYNNNTDAYHRINFKSADGTILWHTQPVSLTGAGNMKSITPAFWNQINQGLVYVTMDGSNGIEMMRSLLLAETPANNSLLSIVGSGFTCNPSYKYLSLFNGTYSSNAFVGRVYYRDFVASASYPSLCGDKVLYFWNDYTLYARMNVSLILPNVSLAAYQSVEFIVTTNVTYAVLDLQVWAMDDKGVVRTVSVDATNNFNQTIFPNQWSIVRIPLNQLGGASIKKIGFSADHWAGNDSVAFLIDELRLSASSVVPVYTFKAAPRASNLSIEGATDSELSSQSPIPSGGTDALEVGQVAAGQKNEMNRLFIMFTILLVIAVASI
ncbi:hypothetical protein PROFUN_09559 [Planoprotostelium fungivorum]|uniref:Uncharacterized protein n=1 Tax=Planoprotostelium fungivorum TaxID=1890364 RepID=A0A2P6MT24_9EUKA|nr:hypothetical protein PROFUN_09559 [Planoprotostelium fungivorum]